MGKQLWAVVSIKKTVLFHAEIQLEYFAKTKIEAKKLLQKLREYQKEARKYGLPNMDTDKKYEIHKVFGIDKGLLFLVICLESDIELGGSFYFSVVDTMGDLQCDTIYHGDNVNAGIYYYAYIYGFDNEQVDKKFEDLLYKYRKN